MAPIIFAQFKEPTGQVIDALGRPLRDLRISVTDHCNFRCTYCMPTEKVGANHASLPHSAFLSFEEITRLAKLFVAHGVEKIRLTGGEPLLRKNIEKLVEMLSNLTTPDGRALDLALTTNGSLLARKAQDLKNAGLKRVNVSLDALDDATFKRINGVNFPVSDVLQGIDVAYKVGLEPIKINMVVIAGVNDTEIVPMARHFKGTPLMLRFIEYMDVGVSNGWKRSGVVPSVEILRHINAEMPLVEVLRRSEGETTRRWRYQDGSGEIGVISSVTQSFCHECTRARLSTEGNLYTCLFNTSGHDLSALLRGGHSDLHISNTLARIWRTRDKQYSAQRATNLEDSEVPMRKIEMFRMGG